MIDPQRTVAAIWRIESPSLIAALTRLTRDVGLAEELAQDAFVLALESWPEQGVPDNPGGWLMATARHKATPWAARTTTCSPWSSWPAIRCCRASRAWP